MARKPKHQGFWMNVDGESVHMLADPNLSPETQHALEELVRAARKMVDEMSVYECPKCGEMRSGKQGKTCTKCMIDEFRER